MKLHFVFAMIWTMLLPCAGSAQTNPPLAKVDPTVLETHGVRRVDDYFWLRDRNNPDVIAYLNAENEYFQQQMRDTESLQTALLAEIIERIPAAETSAPVPDRGFVYWNRIERDQQYRVYFRRLEAGGPEQIILDVNALAVGKPFCSVAGLAVSPDNQRLAYAIDFQGRRKYTIRIKNLEDGSLLPDEIVDVTGNLVWAEDNQTLFYARQDPETLRSFQIFRHTLGADPSQDVLVFQEDDPEFSCHVTKSRSRQFVFIVSSQTLSTEWRYVSATQPMGEFQVFQPRGPEHEYSIDHLGDAFFVRTNHQAKNFRLMKTSPQATGQEHWQEVLPTNPARLLEDFDLFDDFLVAEWRSEGKTAIDIYTWEGEKRDSVEFSEPVYLASTAVTPQTQTPWVRYAFMSLNTPASVREYNVETRETRIIKEAEVLGGFRASDYLTRREWATAPDGTRIPLSIVHHRNTPLDGTAPCLLYGYGSYGASMDPFFDLALLNLLNRGFVYAIAHIRGGQEMGREWYESGKLMKKVNTFTDFIACGEFLVAHKFADPRRLYANGGSAGGLLMGAVVNLRPDLFQGVIADVPFVDVVTTMLDDTIPLTTGEYDEWGNPHEKAAFDYMLSYSPYDNVREVEYPHLLVTSGLHDSQVQYWEPAKWVAKLRRQKKGSNLLLMKTNMEAGHGGASGRMDAYREDIFRQAFLLKLAGISQ